MGIEEYFLAAFWEQRRTTKEECAERIMHFHEKLREIDERFVDLHEVGNSMARPIGDPIGRTVSQIAKQLTDDKQFPDLGFSLYAILPDESICLSVDDGKYTEDTNFSNNALLEFQIALVESIMDFFPLDKLSRIITALVEVYDPILVYMTTSNHREHVRLRGGFAHASWMLYLRHRIDEVPSLPDGVEVRRIGDQGVLIITTQERFCADNAEHVELAEEVTQRLDAAGLLKVPWDLGWNKYLEKLDA